MGGRKQRARSVAGVYRSVSIIAGREAGARLAQTRASIVTDFPTGVRNEDV